LKFTFVYIGRSKFAFAESGLQHYLENIRHLADSAEVVELRDQGSLKEKEADAFLEALAKRKLLDGKSRVFLLDERGKTPSSEEFANQLGTLRDQGVQRFAFVIGGAFGFTDEMRAKFPLLSLSKMTFPHDVARLLIAEQVYRALHILAGGKYHHGN
jgi:23S rRNA (pseudouridine1915-N3)-methyltransferase